MANAANIFDKTETEKIVTTIRVAESKTSGEIRVHVENNCKINPLDRAVSIFESLEMHKTEKRTGVLIYLAVKDHKFSIIGDKGINDVVAEDFWESIKDRMKDSFKDGRFVDGVCYAIAETGRKLQQHFPFEKGDINELPDDISYEVD